MAQIIPKRPVGTVAPEVMRVFQRLKGLPDSWRVWFHVAAWEPEAPEFLLLGPQDHALLLKVSRSTREHAQRAPQLLLLAFDTETPVPGETEEQCLRAFLKRSQREGVPVKALAAAVIFPNLTDRDFKTIEQSGIVPAYRWLDRTWVTEKSTDAWGEIFAATALETDAIHSLRGQFTPEVVVPTAFIARTLTSRRRSAARSAALSLDTYLLDYDQEAVLKSDLDLAPEGEALSRDFGIQLINGVTGSGKTLILLYRLRLLQTRFPHKAYQVFTHNRPLIREMEMRYSILHERGCDAVGWHTFMQWCYHHWPPQEPFDIIPDHRRSRLIQAVWADQLRDLNITQQMFQSELGWLKDNGIALLQAYLEVNRRGRGFRLNLEQRERMFGAIQAYQHRLQKLGKMDWWDVPRRYWHWLEQGKLRPPQYDVILVDEAQFFAPLWFNIVRRLIRPEIGYLFLAADPTQGFLERGESWRAIAGIEVRGRAHLLRRSYRTTRAILTLALTFYQRRLPEEVPDLLMPELSRMQKGRIPTLLSFDAPQDERMRIVREITSCVQQGLPLRDLLVLHSSGPGVQALTDALNDALGVGSARDPKNERPGDFIRVTTLNAGAGLESPVVFISGLHELFELEDSLRLNDVDRAELVQAHTRKLYMAFTRAGQRLVLTSAGAMARPLGDLEARGLLRLGC